MEFCPKCDSAIKVKTDGEKSFKAGIRCEHKEIVDSKGQSLLKSSATCLELEPIRVVHAEEKDLPIYKHDCKKCDSTEAYLVGEIKPDRFNDEQQIFLFQCTGCEVVSRQHTSGN